MCEPSSLRSENPSWRERLGLSMFLFSVSLSVVVPCVQINILCNHVHVFLCSYLNSLISAYLSWYTKNNNLVKNETKLWVNHWHKCDFNAKANAQKEPNLGYHKNIRAFEITFSTTKDGHLGYIISHNIIWANYHWLDAHATFDKMCFPAIL